MIGFEPFLTIHVSRLKPLLTDIFYKKILIFFYKNKEPIYFSLQSYVFFQALTFAPLIVSYELTLMLKLSKSSHQPFFCFFFFVCDNHIL